MSQYFNTAYIYMLQHIKYIFAKRLHYILSVYVCLCMIAYAADETLDLAEKSKEANQNRIVVGLYGGGSIMELSSEYYSARNPYDDLPGNYDKNMFGVSYGVKTGYDMYFLTQHGVRLYLDYMHSYFNSKERRLGTLSMHTIGLNADYRFVIKDFSIFAGVGLVYNIINTQYLGNTDTFGGSLNMGVAYTLAFLEFEFRMRYLAYDALKRDSNYLPIIMGEQTIKHLVELDNPVSFHFGINFRF